MSPFSNTSKYFMFHVSNSCSIRGGGSAQRSEA
jgi:hypothetical protein